MDSNTNEITEKVLLIKEQLIPFVGLANEAITKVRSEGISNYPILIAHQEEANIGIPLLKGKENGSPWSINVSTLEEFYTKKLIQESKLEDFKNLYNNHKNDVCFFVLSEIGAQYLFFPV